MIVLAAFPLVVTITTLSIYRKDAMEKPVSAADANREFSRILQDVKKGNSYIVTSHGKPVAQIAPVGEHSRLAEKARGVLLARLRAEPAVEIGRWTRDELYAR
jgi:prevent-host-death family protein